MRRPERIPIIFKFFKNNPKAYYRFIGERYNKDNHGLIGKQQLDFWLKYPDLRFGQLLVNLNLVKPQLTGKLFYKEEVDWLLEHKYFKPEELLFWGRSLDKNNNPLPKTEYILLKDLKLDHIKNIIKYFEENNRRINKVYMKYFEKRIKEGV